MNKDVLFYKMIRPFVKTFTYIAFTPRIIGKENIPVSGRVILAGNHTNIYDSILLISSTKREIHFLAKSSLWKGFKKLIFANLGLIPVNRDGKDRDALNSAINYLNSELVVGIFPEGTTEKCERKLLPFKKGAVRMAFSTNSCIVPFAITGEYKLFKSNIIIVFGEPYYVDSDDYEKENAILVSKIENLKGGNL